MSALNVTPGGPLRLVTREKTPQKSWTENDDESVLGYPGWG